MTAVVAGHICLDIIPQLSGVSAAAFERSFAPGHLLEVGPASLSTGGAVFAGSSVWYVGAVFGAFPPFPLW